jgi:uncharacterized phiE125 gp8 family phage protein
MTSYKLSTAPAYTTLSLTEAKLQLRVDGDDEDTLIQSLMKAVDQIAENKTNRAFMQSGYTMYSDSWQCDYTLWPAPLVTVASVKYYDSDNVLQTLDTSNYIVYSDFTPGILSIKTTATLPTLYDRLDAVQITYTVGYGAVDATEDAQRAAVPESVRSWIKLNLTTLYEHRQLFTEGSLANISTYADTLIYPYVL